MSVEISSTFSFPLCPLSDCSKDGQVKMTESSLPVYNFDGIKKHYRRKRTIPILPSSADALYLSPGGAWYFIEFKNGKIDEVDVTKKIYDSLVILSDWHEGCIADIDFSRNNIIFILVYNPTKYRSSQESSSRNMLYQHLEQQSDTRKVLFNLNRYVGYIFKNVVTCTPSELEEILV